MYNYDYLVLLVIALLVLPFLQSQQVNIPTIRLVHSHSHNFNNITSSATSTTFSLSFTSPFLSAIGSLLSFCSSDIPENKVFLVERWGCVHKPYYINRVVSALSNPRILFLTPTAYSPGVAIYTANISILHCHSGMARSRSTESENLTSLQGYYISCAPRAL